MANIGALVVKLLLEKGQYKAELDKAVADTKGAAGSVQSSTGAITGAVKDALQGQTELATGATRALAVLGPAAGVAVAAAAAVALAYHQATQETRAYENALILTGNVSGVNAGQMSDMARAIDQVVGTQGQAAAALAAMAGSGRIAGENLQKFAQVAIETERTVGTAVGDTVKQFVELGNDPVKASLRLNETTNYLTAATYEQIKAAVDLGDKERAASIAQNAYADAMSGRTAQIEQNIGTLQKAWRGLQNVAKEAWDAMLNIGREKSVASQLADTTANVDRLAAQVASRQSRGLATGDLDRQLAAAKELQATMRETVKLDEKAATIKGDLARVQQAGVAAVDAVTKANERGASKQDQMNKALGDYAKNIEAIRASNPGSVLLKPETIAATEAAIRKQYDTVAKGGKAAAAAASDYDKLMKRLGVDLPKAAAEAEAAQMGYNKSQTAFLALAASPEWAAFTNEQRKAVAAKYETIIATEQATDAQQAEVKATIAAGQAHEKHLDTQAKVLAKLQEETSAQQEHNDRLGLTKEAIAALDAAKLEEQATSIEGLAIRKMEKDLDEVQYALYMAQVKTLRERAALKREGGEKEAALEATKEIDKENDRMLQSLDKTAHDVWVSVADGGEDAFKRVGKTLKASILDVLYQMTIRKWVMNIGANITGSASGAAGAAGGSGSALDGLGALGSAGQAAFGFSAGASAASLAYANAVGAMGGDALGALIAANGSWAAVGTSAAGLASSIGSFAAAAGPWALAAVAIYGLVKKFDTSGTPHVGQLAEYSAAGGLKTSQKHGDFGMGFGGVDYNEGAATLVQGVSKTIVSILDSTATAFGKAAGYSVATGFADDSSKDGAWGGLLIKQMENVLVNWNDTRSSKWAPKEFADGEAGQKEYLAALSKDVLGTLKAMDLPGWAQSTLDALGDSPALDDLAKAVDQINVTKAALNQMGDALDGFAGLSDGAITALIKASGGIAGLSANASSFFDNFYSEAEKSALATKQVSDALGKVNIAMPTSRDEYRKLVKQYTDMGEAGAPTLAVLLALSGAFAAIVPAADQAAEAVGETLDKALARLRNPTRTVDDVAGNIIGLEDKVFQAENAGNVSALRERELKGLTDTEQALVRRLWALDDEKTRIAEVAAAAEAAAQKAEAIASERTGLENQLLTLLGETGELRARERAALDETNRALYDQIKAEEDRQAVVAAATAVANERTGLENQLLALMGETGEIRARERAALDESNRAIYDQINAIKDRQAAEAAAAAAAANISNEKKSLEQQLLQLTGDTAAIRAAERAALDESNRALYDHINAIKDEQAAASAAAAALTAAANEHAGLQERLWQIQGNSEALRKAALDKLLDDESRRMQQEIWAAEDAAAAQAAAQQAQQAAASAAQQAADQQLAAAKQIKDAWQGVSDSLVDEIKRIRGEMVGDGQVGYAQSQAQFAIALAQANAGDQDAMKSLPALSKAMLDLAQTNAGSMVELRAIQAATAASLEAANGRIVGQYGLTVPSLAVGTNNVPHDMLLMAHAGEAIVPRAYNPALGVGSGSMDTARLEVLVEMLTAKVDRLTQAAEKTRDNTKNMDDTLTRVTHGSDSVRTEAVEA